MVIVCNNINNIIMIDKLRKLLDGFIKPLTKRRQKKINVQIANRVYSIDNLLFEKLQEEYKSNHYKLIDAVVSNSELIKTIR